ncbi:MAG TPA: NRDE family protein [Polyangiaceae bacterium]
MCTLIAIFGIHPDVPLIVAANRDEFYARPWAPPARLSDEPVVFGGRDLTQGGTWLGATEAGFFVAVTNQRTLGARDGSLRSRGQLVLDALRRGSPDAAVEWLAGLNGGEFNPFNLLLGDAGSLYVAYARADPKLKIERLERGLSVLNNDTIGSRDFPKANRVRDLVEPIAREPWEGLAPELERVLGDHEQPPLAAIPEPPAGSMLPREALQALQAVCVHTPVYGTSSSSLLALGERRLIDYRFAPGPPCVTPFVAVPTR